MKPELVDVGTLDHARDIIAEWDATCTQPQPQPEKHDEPL